MDLSHLAEIAVNALDDIKGIAITSLDVTTLTDIADYMIICTGSSNRHVQSLADNVIRLAKEAGVSPLGIEGESGADWVLVDLGDVIVHIMLNETRERYQLEKLWAPDLQATAINDA